MKHIKHWLATLAVLLCCITASAHDFEVDGIYYNITSEEGLTVAVTFRGNSYNQYSDEYSGAVIIPSAVTYNSKTYSVTSIGNEAFQYCRSLTSITLPESVTSIGERAFYYCRSLTSITIPESVTSIGDGAFSGCSSLTAIVVAEGNKVYDSRNGCNAIIETNSNTLIQGCATTIIPESVTSIGSSAFYGCRSLTSITIPESVTSIGLEAFYECSRLTSITIPESVTYIGSYTFSNCSSLISITIPENSQLTIIGNSAFSNCSNLTSITIPEGVTSILFEAFYECSRLTSITIPENSQLTSIGYYTFYNCSSLTSIVLPEKLKSVGSNAFANCTELLGVYCYAESVPSASSDAFDGSYPEYITLHVPSNALESYKTTAPWSSFGNIVSVMPENITLTIGQYGSGTYCSPYALDFSEVEGLKAYAATGYDSETGVVTLTRVMTAKAGMGLFVKGEPGDHEVPVLESTSFNTLNMLVGTLENTDLNGISADGLYANYKYTVKEGDAEPVFYQFADGSTLAAGRAYLQIPTAWLTSTTAKSISYRFDDGETTDIEDIESGIQNSELIYDLMGRRVQTPSKGSVYIVNGKKIVY